MVSTTSSIHHGLCLCYLCTVAAASFTAANPNIPNDNNNENLNGVSHRDTHIRELEGEPPFVNQYVPTNNVDGVAKIDLDIRLVWSKVLLGDSVSIAAARDVYSGGVGSRSDVSLESIGSSSELVDPNIIQEYSGDYDYYDRLMQAVFDNVSTSFVNSDIDFDFSGFSEDENGGFVRHVILGVVMDHIKFCLDQATKSCHNLDPSQSIMHWDEAMAFYTGSISRESGAKGYLFFTESEVQGYQFGTRSGSMSMSNKAVFDNFVEGKLKITGYECGSAEVNAEKIKSQMLIPLIQGLLRNTYQIDNLFDQNEITRGEVSGYAAALLPSINNCDKNLAVTIHNDLAPGQADESSFEDVKYNLERIYGCLGVSCSQVGGFLQPSGTSYWKKAEPCVIAPVPSPVIAPVPSPVIAPISLSDNDSGSSSDPGPLILGLFFGFVFLLAVG